MMIKQNEYTSNEYINLINKNTKYSQKLPKVQQWLRNKLINENMITPKIYFDETKYIIRKQNYSKTKEIVISNKKNMNKVTQSCIIGDCILRYNHCKNNEILDNENKGKAKDNRILCKKHDKKIDTKRNSLYVICSSDLMNLFLCYITIHYRIFQLLIYTKQQIISNIITENCYINNFYNVRDAAQKNQLKYDKQNKRSCVSINTKNKDSYCNKIIKQNSLNDNVENITKRNTKYNRNIGRNIILQHSIQEPKLYVNTYSNDAGNVCNNRESKGINYMTYNGSMRKCNENCYTCDKSNCNVNMNQIKKRFVTFGSVQTKYIN